MRATRSGVDNADELGERQIRVRIRDCIVDVVCDNSCRCLKMARGSILVGVYRETFRQKIAAALNVSFYLGYTGGVVSVRFGKNGITRSGQKACAWDHGVIGDQREIEQV